jgi:hypothetical protein
MLNRQEMIEEMDSKIVAIDKLIEKHRLTDFSFTPRYMVFNAMYCKEFQNKESKEEVTRYYKQFVKRYTEIIERLEVEIKYSSRAV